MNYPLVSQKMWNWRIFNFSKIKFPQLWHHLELLIKQKVIHLHKNITKNEKYIQ